MGAQIGGEYALGGHEVVCVGRRPVVAAARLDEMWAVVKDQGLASAAEMAAAQGRTTLAGNLTDVVGEVDLVVESIAERFEEKVVVLRQAAAHFPEAILASNTSSLSISALGAGAGAPARTVGTHYWNPPLLMPLVEVVRGEETAASVVERMLATLRSLGKRPVIVEREVPGFIWNRLQLALLREAVWLVETGVATPATVDEVVRDGLARRWRYTGPFQTAALGGAATFERIAANLFPGLSAATELRDLGRWLGASPEELPAVKARRDAGLRADLAVDQEATEERGEGSAAGVVGVAGSGER